MGLIQHAYTLHGNGSYSAAWARAGTAAQRLLACDLGLPPERLQLAATPDGEISVTAVVESFARLRALHARIMDEPAMTQWLARTGYALEWVQRRNAEYVARPPPQQDTTCNGGRFYLRGEWVAPPPHGTTTPECYGFVCQEGFEQAGQDCIPALANNSVFWGSVLLILIVIFTVLLTACVVRVAPDAPEAPAKEEEPPLDPFRNALPVAVEVVDGVEALVFEEEVDEDNEEQDNDDEEQDDDDEEQDNDDEEQDNDDEPNL